MFRFRARPIDEPRAVRFDLRCNALREPRLADAARSEEGDEARALFEERRDIPKLARAADERIARRPYISRAIVIFRAHGLRAIQPRRAGLILH